MAVLANPGHYHKWYRNMSILDFFQPPPQECPAPPIDFPESLQDIFPPTPEPEPEPPTPTREALKAAAIVAAAIIAESLREDDECKQCEPCKAVVFGKEYVRGYGDMRTQRVGYEYQHYVVSWFYHDSQNRFIMEWELNGTKFDGLDPKEGIMLVTRAITRTEYDPNATSYCYLIDTKYNAPGKDWFRHNPQEERFEAIVPDFLTASLSSEMGKQNSAFSPFYPNVALIWICSSRDYEGFVKENVIPSINPIGIRSVYYPYIAIEDQE